jgi:hypothetical protein
MKRKTQVPAKVIEACKTPEQRARAEQMFIRAYEAYQDERAAWLEVEIRLRR